MLEWLTGKKKRAELPGYSRLRAVPQSTLPSELSQAESGEQFGARRLALEEELRDHHGAQGDTPRFFSLTPPGGQGVVTFPTPEHGAQCLPLFSHPFRAADYKQVLLRTMPSVNYLASTAAQLHGMLRDLEKEGIDGITLDRCPRCSVFTSFGIRSLKTSGDLLALWAIQKAGETARRELYFAWALRAARSGELEAARDVALEVVGHVSLEDPRPHLLLGELAVKLRDRTMLQEAQTFLRLLDHKPWERRLAEVAESGRALFGDYE